MTPSTRGPRTRSSAAGAGGADAARHDAAPAARRQARAAARRDAGMAAEAIAAAHLESQGLAIVARNVKSRVGEIDLVARDGDVLVFVEVRLRRSAAFGGAAASIDAAKRIKLLRAARLYLARLAPMPACRFDAVLLDGLEASRVEWRRNVIEDAG